MIDHDARQGIAEVLLRYATGIDRRDWALFRTCFTLDCEADYGTVGVMHGAGAITEWMDQAHAGCGYTMHRITNTVVSPHSDGAAARSYVDAIVLAADNQTGTQVVGYYDDELVNTTDGWKISRRVFTMVHLKVIGDARE
ncbi:nuclear transport factor 2 family protein [Frankia sp. AgB1.9]|nr:nuclear transport factor 2 family protein [Frankia sp. AgW1.1]MBL7547989.1 nuclear transport factor 2 family protein [Frankia sp. AgB1.9]MBL7625018.1 nuclear transport factor 2 family protein [Frankia sp. AgB1.8]